MSRSSQWKSGKTTLVSVLLARMARGGEFAGLPVAAGRAAIVSEEGPENWHARCHLSFFCRPFKTTPTMDEWLELIDGMLELRRREGLELLAVRRPVFKKN